MASLRAWYDRTPVIRDWTSGSFKWSIKVSETYSNCLEISWLICNRNVIKDERFSYLWHLKLDTYWLRIVYIDGSGLLYRFLECTSHISYFINRFHRLHIFHRILFSLTFRPWTRLRDSELARQTDKMFDAINF